MTCRGGNIVATLLLGAGLLCPAAGGATQRGNSLAYSDTCKIAISRIEDAMRLPTSILQAISLAESGRWHKASRSHFAWPWTVTARGKGRFYPSKDKAIAAVRRLKAEGVRNIDVGCMQVNLMYHPKAFDSLEQAFDPHANARYAGELFSKLRRANRSITHAIAHYHSTTREYNRPYTRKVVKLWNKVVKLWNQERRRYYAEQRKKKLTAWQAERARRDAARQTPAGITPRR